jgi:hypothetical protein
VVGIAAIFTRQHLASKHIRSNSGDHRSRGHMFNRRAWIWQTIRQRRTAARMAMLDFELLTGWNLERSIVN